MAGPDLKAKIREYKRSGSSEKMIGKIASIDNYDGQYCARIKFKSEKGGPFESVNVPISADVARKLNIDQDATISLQLGE